MSALPFLVHVGGVRLELVAAVDAEDLDLARPAFMIDRELLPGRSPATSICNFFPCSTKAPLT